MTFQRLTISMILIVLSIVHINASNDRLVRQVTNNCPANACDYVTCVNGQCKADNTVTDCYKCQCPIGFTGQLCETAIPTRFQATGCNPPCQNGGLCLPDSATTFVCACLSNFTGSQCETSIIATHPCVTMPGSTCQNGGTCTINGADFLCDCAVGFSGRNCEVQGTTTACTANLCGVHGTCYEILLPTGGATAICICESTWTGQFCDSNPAGTCVPGFCQSGGTCVMSANGPYCLCLPEYTGGQCQTSVLSTTTSTGISTATTTEISTATTTGIFTPTTTGALMTTNTATIRPTSGSCTLNTCLNGGTCYNTGNDFICLCKPEYSGVTCAIQSSVTTALPTTASSTNACAPNPCNNGGTCYRYGNSFVCLCLAQYAGQTCDAAKTTPIPTNNTTTAGITCAAQPCQNGATCYNAGNGYFCYCGTNSNYAGTNCDTPKVTADPSCPLDCSPGYCVNAGLGQSSYACMCNGALTPDRCSRK